MSAKTTVEEKPLGLVIYTDGGCRPNPGFGGWGAHGYLYSDHKPKKGAGLPTHYLTPWGYVEKSAFKDDKKAAPAPAKGEDTYSEQELALFKNTLPGPQLIQVKPLKYLDGVGSFGEHITNNIAEVVGATNALHYAANHDLQYVTVYTDSEQVVKAANGWIELWKQRGWLKSDGQPVANKQYWVGLGDSIDALKAKGVHVGFQWVRGHSTYLGNQKADMNATVGVFHSRANASRSEITLEEPEGYWKARAEKPAMITHRSLYFNTNLATLKPGEYMLGNHGKEDDHLGKRTTDGAYAFVRLKEPEVVIETLRQRQVQICSGSELLVIGRLDVLYEREAYNCVLAHGHYAMDQDHPTRYDLRLATAELVTCDLRTPRLAYRAVNEINLLQGILQAFEAGDARFHATDLTDVLYEPDKKDSVKLRAEFGVGCTTLTQTLGYGTPEGLRGQEKVDLVFGVDLPERNALKRLEGQRPKVQVLTWMESEKMFRFATVIHAGEDAGIWAGAYSNMRFVAPTVPVASAAAALAA